MFSMTEAAGARLAGFLERDEAPEDAVLRLEREEGELTLRHGHAHPGDSTLAHEGRTVLVVHDELYQELADNTLDVEDTDEGPRFHLR